MKIQSTLLLLSLAGGLAFAVSPVSAHCGACSAGGEKAACAAGADKAACAAGCEKACCATKECTMKETATAGCCGAASQMAAGEHKLTGQIVNIDAAKRVLVVKHDEIPGVMGAMTMGFTVPECCDISTLKKGDKIAGMMVKDGQSYLLKGPKVVTASM